MNTPQLLINERYEIIRRIGRGGMADVFLGRDRQLNRQVAIKVLFPEFAVDPNFVERFRREAQAAANLNHPNIVNVFDWGKSSTTYYIAMEYVEGRTLADILRSNQQLTSKQAAEIASEVAAALGYAHSAGLVHRDIKPANILIGTRGTVKVADFGIARALNSPTESNLTQAGAVMGTATYFSPEQAQGAQPDPRSDLYSLGVVLYEMIAGRPPFTGDNPVAIAYKQVHDYPTPLNKIVFDVPRAFEAIVAKLLTKDPKVRYSTADSLREDLRRFRNGEMPVALMAASPRATGQQPVIGGPAARRGPNGGQRPSQQVTGVVAGGRPAGEPGGRTGVASEIGYHDAAPSRTGWYALAAFFALLALGIGGFLLFTTLTRGNAESDSALPDLVGRPLQEAINILDDRELSYRAIDDEDDPQYGPGIVFRTNPGERTIVQPGTVIDLYYNAVDETSEIPDVAGMTLTDAQARLADAGFINVGVEFEADDSVDPRTVLRTNPGAGETIGLSDALTIVATPGSGDAGPATTEADDLVQVPYVIGYSEDEARQRIESAGFVVEVEYFDGFAAEVLDQFPHSNEQLASGETVRINVGRPSQTQPPPPTDPPPAQTQPPQTNPPPATSATTTPPPPPPTTAAPTTTTQPPTTTVAQTTTTPTTTTPSDGA